ncbi:hypothetical protein BH23VER1_BH23VER1_27780 [soil metagenome]
MRDRIFGERGGRETEEGGAAAPAPDTVLTWAGSSHRGRFKPNNEDACLCLSTTRESHTVLPLDGTLGLESADLICAVSDGMGGANAGERASELVVAEIARYLPNAFRTAALGMDPDHLGILDEALSNAHDAIAVEADAHPERRGMGATLSLCWFTPGRAWFAHVGDSRIYRIREGKLRQLTEDHTRVGQLLRAGLINERQARGHPRRHVLQQALGAGLATPEPQLGSIHYAPGDQFLLCSDGLTDGLWDKNIAQIFADTHPGRERDTRDLLLDRSLRASGMDNVSLIVVGAA